MRILISCKWFFYLLAVSLLFGCGHSRHVEVRDLRQAPLTAKNYTVEKGDTLYSIAWRFDFDYRRLATANNIVSPYTLYIGQILLLEENATKTLKNTVQKKGIIPKLNKQTHKKTLSASKNSTARQENQPSGGLGANTSSNSQKRGVKKRYVESKTSSTDIGWLWPVSGKVVRQFSPQNKLSKGIDIAAKMNQPIRSSRSGKVVYAGNGLKGYGNLIIVRHSDIYLSAYAHNKSILVKEGSFVQQGQKIALLGDTGTQSPKLHFEIRKRGKPINPLKLLPKQK